MIAPMQGRTLKTLARALALSLVAGSVALGAPPADAATPAGTNISNAATATYQDGSGTNFTTNSNTVTVVVQNVAIESVTDVTTSQPQNIAPYQTVTDKFLLTNSGNSSGKFQLTALPTPTQSSGTAPTTFSIAITPQGGGTYTYVYTGTAATDLAAINTQLNTYSIPAGNTVAVNVIYNSGSFVATANQTDTTTLSATLAYAGGGGYAAQTTAASSATQNDVLQPDAVLDVQKSDTPPVLTTDNIKYDLKVANHGAYATQPVTLSSIGAGLPASGVIAAIDAIPAVAGVPLALKTVPTVATNAANGYAGATASLYFTTATPSFSGATTWTQITGATTVPGLAGATYLAAVVTGPSSIAGKGSGFSSAATVPSPALTVHFEIAQPAKGTSVTNMANSIAGSNATDTSGNPVPLLVGPNSTGSYDDTAVNAADLNGMLQNTRATNDAPAGTGSGFSNRVSDTAVNGALALGPLNQPAATGAFSLAAGATAYYDSGTADNNHDFTALALFGGQTSGSTYTTPASPAVIAVPNSLVNNGNVSDTFTLTSAANANTTGWTVQYSASSTCAGATSAYTTPSVAAAASFTFYACYTPPASTALSVYAPYGYAVTATSVSDNTASNTTYDLFYAGGFVAVQQGRRQQRHAAPGRAALRDAADRGLHDHLHDHLPEPAAQERRQRPLRRRGAGLVGHRDAGQRRHQRVPGARGRRQRRQRQRDDRQQEQLGLLRHLGGLRRGADLGADRRAGRPLREVLVLLPGGQRGHHPDRRQRLGHRADRRRTGQRVALQLRRRTPLATGTTQTLTFALTVK